MYEGIVLTRTAMREHDAILSILTRDIGKVDVLARGVKKITSKLSSQVTEGAVVFFHTVEGKELRVLTNAICTHRFLAHESTYASRLQMGYAIYLMHHLTRSGNNDTRLYHFLHTWLEHYSVDYDHHVEYLNWYVWHLMKLVGFSPHYETCVRCHAAVGLLHWSHHEGGVVCNQCAEKHAIHSDGIINTHVCSLFTSIDQSEVHAPFVSADISNSCVRELMRGYLEYHIECAIQDWGHTCEECQNGVG